MERSLHLSADKSRCRFEFISVLAHELKAPINAVEGYLALLRDGGVSGNVEIEGEILDRCAARIAGMRKLIDDLLDLTRIESGQRRRAIVPLDLFGLAQDALDTVRPEANRRGIQLALISESPLQFNGDRSEIEIMLNNLISNAVKYNRDGGKATVMMSKEGRRATIAVSDSGIGMSEDEVEKLFKEFVRIRNQKTQHVLGSGLGLSILRKLALLYEGDIEIASEPDVGSVFTVHLCEPGMDAPRRPQSALLHAGSAAGDGA